MQKTLIKQIEVERAFDVNGREYSATTSIYAVSEDSLSGRIALAVRGADGSPMVGARVEFVNTLTGDSITVASDDVGTVATPEMPTGEYEARILEPPIPGGRWSSDVLLATIINAGSIVLAGDFSMYRG